MMTITWLHPHSIIIKDGEPTFCYDLPITDHVFGEADAIFEADIQFKLYPTRRLNIGRFKHLGFGPFWSDSVGGLDHGLYYITYAMK